MIYEEINPPKKAYVPEAEDEYFVIGYYHRGDNKPVVYECYFQSKFGPRFCTFNVLEVRIKDDSNKS